jgi:hydroxyacylglutathione hydrolase
MLLRRIYHDRLAQAAYLVGCEASKEAIVVDPLRDPAPYLEAAREEGMRIVAVTETHVHADFLSGAPALAQAAHASLLLSGEGGGPAGYRREAFPGARWLRDGERLTIGAVAIDVMHVPGHTPEHLAFLVTDTAVDNAPMGMLSGDFLFVGDVGRPDLLERAAGLEGTMEEAARQLHASLGRLQSLPDYLQIWPGHGAGSACGKALGAVPQSTLGYERRTNWALGVRGEAEFVARVLEGQPEPPAYFARMKARNTTRVAPPGAWVPANEDALWHAIFRGALAVDVRPPQEFTRGHLAKSINVPLGHSFLGWAGSVIPEDRDVVLIAPRAERASAERAAVELRLIGLERALGVLTVERVAAEGVALVTLPTIPAADLDGLPARNAIVLDVRSRSEWSAGHMPGARLIPLPELAGRLQELRGGGPIMVHCQGGSRSAIAASMLAANGFDEVANLGGGFAAWVRAGHTPAIGD